MKQSDRELVARVVLGVAAASGRTSEAAFLGKHLALKLGAFVDNAGDQEMPLELLAHLPELEQLYALYADGFESLRQATQDAIDMIPKITKAPT